VLERGRCEARPTSPLHCRSVRCDELNFQLSTLTFGLTTKLQHIPTEAIHMIRKGRACWGTKVGLLRRFIVGMFALEALFIGVIALTSRSTP